jgi:hypothetical protein
MYILESKKPRIIEAFFTALLSNYTLLLRRALKPINPKPANNMA